MDGAAGWSILCAWLGFPAWPETRQSAGRQLLSAGIVTKLRPSRDFQKKKTQARLREFFFENPGAAGPGEPGFSKKKPSGPAQGVFFLKIPARPGNGWGGWVVDSLCVAGVPGVAGNTTVRRPPLLSAGIVTKLRPKQPETAQNNRKQPSTP